ncbi:MAG: SprB repeat-containing protein, partial [Bacteroidota bacterium]
SVTGAASWSQSSTSVFIGQSQHVTTTATVYWGNGPTGTVRYAVTNVHSGCTWRTTKQVTINPSPVLDTVITDASSPNASDGAIDLIVSGGMMPYTYAWSNGQTTEDLNNIAPGFYDVTVTGANGCAQELNLTVDPFPLMASIAKTPLTCPGDSSGALDLTVSLGVPPYQVTWSTGDTAQDLSGLPAGTYTVTVSDGFTTVVLTDTLSTPPSLQAMPPSVVHPLCPGGMGQATVTANGVAPFGYLWSNGATTATANLPAGTHFVTVTDANNCASVVVQATVVDPIAPAIVPASILITDPTCFQGADGVIDVIVFGGVAPLTYQWSSGQTTALVTGLTSGTYSVTVTDANACNSWDTSLVVTDPLQVKASIPAISTPTCVGDADGAIQLMGINGTPPYSYAWSNGQTGNNLVGLTAGTYSLTVTDVNGCVSNSLPIVISDPAPIMITLTTSNDPSCFGESDGEAMVLASQGTPPYTYTWSNGQSGPHLMGVAAGNYAVSVTDSNGCAAVDSTIAITNPAPIVVNVDTVQDEFC